jgi:major type 1 subunit fimbrin (pilin)
MAAAVVALPLPGVASDGVITFTGAVTANSCSISVNGGGKDATVTLPVVDAAALANGSGTDKAAGTFFSIALSACDNSHADSGSGGNVAPTLVAIYFEAGSGIDAVTGGAINSGTSNVEVNLYKASGAAVVGAQITPGRSASQPDYQAIGSTGTQWYFAGYSTAGAAAAATAGTVNAVVTYSLVYP